MGKKTVQSEQQATPLKRLKREREREREKERERERDIYIYIYIYYLSLSLSLSPMVRLVRGTTMERLATTAADGTLVWEQRSSHVPWCRNAARKEFSSAALSRELNEAE